MAIKVIVLINTFQHRFIISHSIIDLEAAFNETVYSISELHSTSTRPVIRQL